MRIDTRKLSKRVVKFTAVASASVALLFVVLRAVYAVTLFNGFTGSLSGAGWTPTASDSVMQGGEKLTYEAKYLFFKIGSVKMQVLGKTVFDGVPAYHVRADINSYSGIPFVNLHAIYDTYQDANTFMCLFTSNTQKDGNDTMYTVYHFNFQKKVMDWQLSKNGKPVKDVRIPLDKNYTDGLSFFYYLRDACRKADGRKTSMTIPIVVDTNRSQVELTVNERAGGCEVTAYKFPVKGYRLSGRIDFTGFFGVTGNFTGWMSADDSEVPLKANVSVIIGSVVVSLKDVQRSGWVPQKSDD